MNSSMTNARIEGMSRKELLTRIFGSYDGQVNHQNRASLIARAKRIRNRILQSKWA